MEIQDTLVFSKRTALDYEMEPGEGNNYMEDEDVSEMELGHQKHYDSLKQIQKALTDRDISYELAQPPLTHDEDFEDYDLYIVAGGDGTLLDAHAYIGDEPTITINSDPERSTGALMRFEIDDFESALEDVLDDTYEVEEWTRAEVLFEDGQKDMALNEVVVGPHEFGMPANYTIEPEGINESHSSTGLIASTGAGSTGWYSPVHEEIYDESDDFPKDAEELRYIAWHTGDVDTPKGVITKDDPLTIRSDMNHNGAVKFDGHRRPKEFLKGREIEIKPGKPLNVVV